ncbi:DUF3473 domain-containing protein [Paenibacillus filicis]|uniref:DUF3473 domain-containing protein n=1 Tax=Paenibacillus gyeongsangnamensis TaxID=3388067 RepID=A0ABT4Q6X8_9BACL|nr:DUF3473 domain-containing protein [Paenibacillus filicis]MCZ8512622.1 DUF3473 domain-containing protein [Paenibacillus filicis]
MLNALTVDVEDWYMTSDFDIPHQEWHRFEDRVAGSTRMLLELFEKYEVKGTFFILGCVASRHPELVAEIAGRGHEIASHGYWHRMLTRLSEEEFREDLRLSKRLLEEISGSPVTMFRAPSWSIAKDRFHYLRIMEEEGFHCDSSLQPFRTPLSGVDGAPLEPFMPVVNGRKLELLEFPPTVLQMKGIRMPFSGGFYLRVLPYPFIRQALRSVNRTRPGMIYIHPWEVDPDQPRLPGSPLVRLSHYYRLRSTLGKLERLLQDFEFVPLGKLLEPSKDSYPAVALGNGQPGQAAEESRFP